MGTLFGHGAIAQVDPDALQQWKDQKYSMFIHFGIYSQLGGVWDGKNIDRGLSEQIQAHAGIYSDTYAAVADDFNPTKWNPDSIALLAKNAGMKSIVITSKHHDGFCMFDASNTDFDIVDATPYKRDIVKELANACRAQGLKFGLYFSLIDWHYPQASPISSHNSDYITPEHHQYNMQQVTDLLTHYGPISELWFDMGSMSKQQSIEMRALVHRLQPNCMIGSRIGNNRGDFDVMGDNQEPDYIIGVPWQSPASFFDETWGYRSWQVRTGKQEKFKEKLTSLIRVASRGGNYLLNIGPKGDGSVVDYERDVLLMIGDWLKNNGEAIYGTQPDPFHVPFGWGSITTKGNTIYLHLLNMPHKNVVLLPGLKGKVGKAYSLHGQTKVKASATDDGVVLEIPDAVFKQDVIPVVALEMPQGYTVPPINILAVNNTPVLLGSGNAFHYYSTSGVDYNTRLRSTVKEAFTLAPTQSGAYSARVYYSSEESGKTMLLHLNGKPLELKLENGQKMKIPNDRATLSFGKIYLAGPMYAGIDGANGDPRKVDSSLTWPSGSRFKWEPKTDWHNGHTYWLPAKQMNAYYVLQQVHAEMAQNVLVRFTGGDGLMVFLNGEKAISTNNLNKVDSLSHTVMLPLQKGNNQILVKVFNNFHKKVPVNIDFNIPQEGYVLTLRDLQLEKDHYFPVSWELSHPETPHENLGFVNLFVEVAPKK